MERNETIYVESVLDGFVADGYLSDILYIVKTGKEGTVFCCRGGPLAEAELVAAKVYHQLERRGFRNDAAYQSGRMPPNRARRERAALQKHTRHGRDVQFGMWVESEFQTLLTLSEAGADIPAPIARGRGAVLMEFIGDENGAAAALNSTQIDARRAPELLRSIVRNVALWLEHHRVHADLSPYNLLCWNGGIVAIDFPQAVDPRFNHEAQWLLERDLSNVCRYFSRFGIEADSARIAQRLWDAYRHGMPLQ